MNLDYEKAYNDFKKQKEEREVFELAERLRW